MLRRLVLLATLALLAVSLPALAQAPQGPRSSFSAAQRAEIVEILRNALRTDPSILRDAVMVLQNADSERETAAARQAIVSLNRLQGTSLDLYKIQLQQIP